MSTSLATTDLKEFEEYNISKEGHFLHNHEDYNLNNKTSPAQGSCYRLIQTLEYCMYHQEQELIEHYTDPERLEEPIPNNLGIQAGENPNLTNFCLHITYNRVTEHLQISTPTLS